MKKTLRVLSLLVALLLVGVVVASCAGSNETTAVQTEAQTTAAQTTAVETQATTEPAGPYQGFISELVDGQYARAEDEDIFEGALADYEVAYNAATAESDPDKRFVLYAKAEALLLDSGVMLPTTTEGGAYTISRIAPHTVPYVQWGNDDDRLKSLVISDEFLTKAERAELLEQWSKACAGEGTYDPAAYLTGKGHTIQTTYKTTFSTAPETIDWLNTSQQSDTEITVNTVDGLVEYTNLNKMVPALAESWTVSDDGLTYTFKLREGVYWYTSEGTQYAEVVAQDFVSGFQHVLDGEAGLDWLVDGVVKGVGAYVATDITFADVGCKATGKYTVEYTLERPTSYFLTMLTYSCFLPICTDFYVAHGGVFGYNEYKEAVQDTEKYTFGKSSDVSSQVYCGAFLLQKLDQESEIVIVKNPNYYRLSEVTIDSVTWIKDGGENPTQTYNDVVAGVYAGTGLTESTGTLALAKADGNFDKYSYISDTTSTSYICGLNLNRGTFNLESGACTSTKSQQQRADTSTALNNKNFRQAIGYAFDKATWNAVSRGADLAVTNIRNMYTHPQFVSLSSDQTDADGKTFKAGTFYGEMVQYYLVQLGSSIKVDDQIDGYFNPELAKEKLAKAIYELGDSVSYPILLDVVYYTAATGNVAQAQAFKKIIEGTLGSDKVQINLIPATTTSDFYACGYRAADGKSANYDIFYGSGWGPDYGDPSTYINTFAPYNGYMNKVIGLW